MCIIATAGGKGQSGGHYQGCDEMSLDRKPFEGHRFSPCVKSILTKPIDENFSGKTLTAHMPALGGGPASLTPPCCAPPTTGGVASEVSREVTKIARQHLLFVYPDQLHRLRRSSGSGCLERGCLAPPASLPSAGSHPPRCLGCRRSVSTGLARGSATPSEMDWSRMR